VSEDGWRKKLTNRASMDDRGTLYVRYKVRSVESHGESGLERPHNGVKTAVDRGPWMIKCGDTSSALITYLEWCAYCYYPSCPGERFVDSKASWSFNLGFASQLIHLRITLSPYQ